ncbi:MAG: hypothetical protein IPH76_17430 [Xanthomonadales bacterium]|nr:hypothetical protein [Xanthomonadales bacterium]
MDSNRRRFMIQSAGAAVVPMAAGGMIPPAEAAPAWEPGFDIVALGGLDPFRVLSVGGHRNTPLRPSAGGTECWADMGAGFAFAASMASLAECWQRGAGCIALEATASLASHADACMNLASALCGAPVWRAGVHVHTTAGWTSFGWNSRELGDPLQHGMAHLRRLHTIAQQPGVDRVAVVLAGFDWHGYESIQDARLRSLDRLIRMAHRVTLETGWNGDVVVHTELGRNTAANAAGGSDHGPYRLRMRIGRQRGTTDFVASAERLAEQFELACR